jgi:hypothetical protein
MLIRFELELMCGDVEPSRFISTYRGKIFDYPKSIAEDDDGSMEPNVKIGEIELYYVDQIRIINEEESLYEAMDCISVEMVNCYEALVDQDEGGWKEEVQQLIGEDASFRDNILLINRLHIEEPFRGKRKGAEVVQEVISRFGSTRAVIVCKPFPLQYRGYESEKNAAERETPGYETKRLAAFRAVAQFWKNLGFQKLPSSEHYVWIEQ